MSDTQQTEMTESPVQTADNIEDFLQGFEIQESQESSDHSGPSSGRTMERDCAFYSRNGWCTYGNNCRFNHPTDFSKCALYYTEGLPERVGEPDCQYFLRTGTCKYGPTCKFHHPKDRNGAGPVVFNVLGFPMREGEEACPFYVRNGTCKFAAACKFHHPEPASDGNAIAANGQASSPSRNRPFVGGFPSLPLPTATYGSGVHIQNPQTYMPAHMVPFMFSPHAWNSYLGNVSFFGSQVPMMTVSAQNLPEKPDQPNCWYFMGYGVCKYGADCRYNHPKERNSQQHFPASVRRNKHLL